MKENWQNKKKIVNDPVYGFINIPSEIVFDIIEHKYFQRLRRIKQLGLTEFVYPGAVHTRFQHTLGAIHLLNSAINGLKAKGHEITEVEEEAVTLALLLHDIGHGPFSHTLEKVILEDYSHEQLSLLFMNELNEQYNGKLTLAISIFKNEYPKKFLHQLISSQLDMDRLDYLSRDSFYTGVSEGVVSSDRIIKMLNISNDQLVVEAKGIYSIEKFLIARWLMYWQVYLHKTVVSAEQLLLNIFKRVRELIRNNENMYLPDELAFFLKPSTKKYTEKEILENFSCIDDTDIIVSLKKWSNEKDKVLSTLSLNILHRNLYKIEIQNTPFEASRIENLLLATSKKMNFSENETGYFVFTNHISKNAYSAFDDKIQIVYKDGKVVDVADASDMLNMSVLSKIVHKYFLCYPKEI
ncbi:MAG: phosphohydrolase [Bacteroidetes bacterium GWC2_33_15]|nr:MAG: phosphohydrolase [Bacteroidetes bacterium GWA2_33_15]OFX51991.1 MAG: phosphohydrolase [Bacteroidetes bacterium GWC2_33_15]OFX63821.1 MAG: phosphohydrolase [Bacteroidetes bacterium GWB2_32_14]OFX67394.1 MAG: phosphohydrolase [Bacteroidetes bacterium GWD2_33_33]HAN17843.1 phosphohydrolase [Bacteroidales bacterium]